MNIGGLWDQLVDAVCRPPRDDGYAEADLVGGRRASFRLYDRRYYRLDVTLENNRGQKLQCSHYRPCVVTSSDGRLPCVIYCHCNSGSRRDAEEILYHMLPKGVTVFAFDFAGSGLSDGGYVTLGALEVDDLAAVVQYLREEGSTSTIGLWGRSMGAVTALLYSQQDPSIAGMVLDSPFSRLVDLMMELATDQQLRIPKPLLKVALAMLKRSVRKRACFSVDKVAPLDCVNGSFIPALFGHASDDTFVHKHHSERLFQAYAGDKNFVSFEGDHNSVRPDFFYDSALIFLVQALRVEELVGPSLDLQALPEDALPHLRAPHTSIYVTASRNLAAAELDAALAEAGSGGSSPASSPRSGASLSRTLSHLSRSGMSRTLSPPWALEHLRSQPSARRTPDQLAASLHALQQGQGQGQGADGGDAAHQQDGGADLAADLGAFSLNEDEALQMALEASLQDARQQAQQAKAPEQQQGVADHGEAGAAAAGGQAPAALVYGTQQVQQQQEQEATEQEAAEQAAARRDAAPSLHTRYNPAFASSGGEGARNPLYSRSAAAEVPHSIDEEQAMLEAAMAASLAPAQQGTPAAAGEARDGSQPSGGAIEGGGSSETELRYYYGSAKRQAAAGAGAAAEEEQQQAGGVGEEREAVPAERAAGLAPQASADAHAGSEAAAVRAPSLQLQHALSDAAAAALAAGGAGDGAEAGQDGGERSGP